MSGHRILNDLAVAPFQAADPGDAGTFAIDRDRVAYCLTVGAAGETRTLPQPTKAGLEATVNIAYTAGGAVTLTVTGSYDGSATTLSLDAAGDWVKLISVATSASAFQWRLINGGSGASPGGGAIPGLTASIAELNILDGVTATYAELNYCDVTTLGTAQESKCVTSDANIDTTGIRHLTATGTVQAEQLTSTDDASVAGTLTVGVNGVGGEAGKVTLRDGANPGYAATVQTDAQTANLTVHVPDPGNMVDAYVALSTAALTAAEVDVLDAVTPGTVTASLAVVVDASKDIGDFRNVGYSGALTAKAGAAVAAVAARFGATATEGLEIKVIDETVNLTNAVETNLTETVPSGAVILSVQANNQTTVVGDGTGDDGLVKVGIGTTADPDKYGKSADLVQNTKIDTIPDWAVLSGAETVTVKGCDAGGAAVTEKFVADNPAGTRNQVRVRIVYAVCNSLDNAV